MNFNVIGETKSKLALSDAVFAKPYNEGLVHQAVVAYLAGGRQGTRAQKTRAEVRGGGKKPWKQKGSGRARAGTIRSPLWRKGGKIFAAKPQNFTQKINKKMYREAMRSLLSELARREILVIVNEIQCKQPKTKDFIGQLNKYDVKNGLVVVEAFDANLFLSARNLPFVEVQEVTALNPVSLLSYDKVVMTAAAAKRLEELLEC